MSELYGLAKIKTEKNNLCGNCKKNEILKASFVYRYRKRYETEINNMCIDRSRKYLLPDQSNIRKSVFFFAINLQKTNRVEWSFQAPAQN